MRSARPLVVPALALLALFGTRIPVRGQSVDEERIVLLEFWAEQPLDLAEATVEELAILPGLDLELAEAIVGLRASGSVASLDDLLAVPGVTRSVLDEIEPYLRVHPRRLWGTWAVSRSEWRETRVSGTERVRVEHPKFELTGVAPSAPDVPARGSVHVRAGGMEVFAGDLRPRIGGGMFLDDPLPRSRTAPASRTSPSSVRARTDSDPREGVRGGVVVFRTRSLAATIQSFDLGSQERWRVAGLESRRRESWWGVAAARPARARRLRGSMYAGVRRRRQSIWGEWVTTGGRQALNLCLRDDGRRWSVGADATAAPRGLEGGVDPVTGRRLDRRHEVLQGHLTWRGSGTRLRVLARRLVRGGFDEERAEHRLRMEFTRRTPSGKVEVTWTEDRADVLESRLVLRLTRERPGRRQRLVFTRTLRGPDDGVLLAAEFGAGLRWRASLGGATAFGVRTTAWSVHRPLVGSRSLWVDPGNQEFWLAGSRIGRRWAAALWGWAELGEAGVADRGFGMTVDLRSGSMVRRLHR